MEMKDNLDIEKIKKEQVKKIKQAIEIVKEKNEEYKDKENK